jgi:hypothetical protein
MELAGPLFSQNPRADHAAVLLAIDESCGARQGVTR